MSQRPTSSRQTFGTIVADPPWRVKAGPGWNADERTRDLEYPTLSLDEIRSLGVDELAAADAHLYLWTINRYVDAAYDIAREWRFEPSTLLTWCKPPNGGGLGGAFSPTTEFLLFCRRGRVARRARVDTTWFPLPRGRHSAKPEVFQDMIEAVSPGPYLELFARRRRRGWAVWGNEVRSDVGLRDRVGSLHSRCE